MNNLASPLSLGSFLETRLKSQLDDCQEEDDAAMKIQANFKGYKARKRVKKIKADKAISENLGINLEDPEVQAAATKIQAGFRDGLMITYKLSKIDLKRAGIK